MASDLILGGAGGFARSAPEPEPAAFGDVPSQKREVLPLDLRDEIDAVVPEFWSRRKAELLPPLRAAEPSKALDTTWCKALARADWQSGFRWGVGATVGGLCLIVTLAVGMLK